MNTTHVTLPDGRKLVIEGADARQTADIVKNQFVRNIPEHAEAETPLEVPALNFAKTPVHSASATDEETPLVMPSSI